jgi:hypothetical protein
MVRRNVSKVQQAGDWAKEAFRLRGLATLAIGREINDNSQLPEYDFRSAPLNNAMSYKPDDRNSCLRL